MNRKIPFHELSSHIASITGIGVESAEHFIKNFFELLSESLIIGECIRIKGIGTFSIAETDGERHVDFVADKEMSDAINAPFAMFEPVKLNDAVSDEMLSKIEAEEESQKVTESEMIGLEETNQEPDSKIIDTVTETIVMPEATAAVIEPAAPTIPPTNEVSVAEIVSTETPEPEEEKKEPKEPKVVVTPPLAVRENITSAPVVTPVVKSQSNSINITPLEEDTEEYVEKVDNGNNGGNGNFWTGLLVGLIVGIALGACAIYFAIDYFFPSSRDAAVEESVEIEEVLPPLPLDSIAPEEAASDTVAPIAAAVPEAAAQQSTEEPAQTTATKTEATPTPKIVKDTIRRGYLIHDMAKKFYGSKDFWVYIYEENKSKIGNPNNMQPGVVLVIPPAEKYGIVAGNAESLRKARNKAAEILKKYPR